MFCVINAYITVGGTDLQLDERSYADTPTALPTPIPTTQISQCWTTWFRFFRCVDGPTPHHARVGVEILLLNGRYLITLSCCYAP